jgi:rod shape-determining protein MreD
VNVRHRSRFYFLVALSFLIALIFSVFPLSFSLSWWRPEFVLLVALYWIFFMPLKISLLSLGFLGLFQDLLESVPFGQHSLGLVIVAYIGVLSYQRLVNYSLWQQSFWIFILVSIVQCTDTWVQTMMGQSLSGLQFFYSALTSALLWPSIVRGMNYYADVYRE